MKELEAFQKRVVDEKSALDGNISRLAGFLGNVQLVTLPLLEQVRLFRQYDIMRNYSQVLGERIAAFE